MRKIRNFNMGLPFKEIRRRVLRGAAVPPPGLEDARLAALLQRAEAALAPSVLFESFGPDSPETAKLSPLPGVAHTVALASLGKDFGPRLEELATEHPAAAKALEAAAAVAGERAVQFVLSLIKDEVEDERCDLSPIHYVADPEALALVAGKLDAAKIGVSVEAGHLAPAHARAFCVSWLARKGKRGAKRGVSR